MMDGLLKSVDVEERERECGVREVAGSYRSVGGSLESERCESEGLVRVKPRSDDSSGRL